MILAAIFIAVWLVSVMALVSKAVESYSVVQSICFGLAAVVLFALPFAVGIASMGESDPHASTLCVHGHEIWEHTQRPPIIAPKVFIPGGIDTHKAWVCEQWADQ